MRAGYSRKTARNIAAENPAKPYIAHAIATQTAARLKRIGLTADMVMEAIRRQVVADIADLYNEDGSPKPLYALTVEERAQIADVEVALKNVAAGDGHVDTVYRYRREARTKYVELACRHFGLIEPENAPRVMEKLVIVLQQQRPADWHGSGGRM